MEQKTNQQQQTATPSVAPARTHQTAGRENQMKIKKEREMSTKNINGIVFKRDWIKDTYQATRPMFGGGIEVICIQYQELNGIWEWECNYFPPDNKTEDQQLLMRFYDPCGDELERDDAMRAALKARAKWGQQIISLSKLSLD